MNKIVKGKNYRFTVITDYLLRIEEDPEGEFEDRPTVSILNRNFASVHAKVIENNNGHLVEIITPGFHLYYDGGKFSPDTLYVDVKKAYSLYQNRWYFGTENDGRHKNLKGTARTLDHGDGAVPLEDGIMSKDGFSYLDDSKNFIFNKAEDEFIPRDHKVIDGYLFAYGREYQKELKDFYKLTGPTPLIPRYALGNWWSRFYPYTQAEYKKLMEKFDEKQIPINVSVLDMDWHKNASQVPQKYGSAWTGYSWNKDLFPEPDKLLKWLHDDGKKVSLNDHPASGIRAFEDCYKKVAEDLHLNTKEEEPATFDLSNSRFRKAYFDDVHRSLENQGVDLWWLDWQQGKAKTSDQLDPLWLLNHYVYEDSNKTTSGDGLILSRYAGPGSHRYPLGFSGDTVISWDSLDFQPYFTITAANIGYTWWSHDIGGHMRGTFDGELATRWLQFGVFSPINRLHSSNNLFSGKEPWNYRIDYEKTQEKFLRLRDKFIPYIDTANYHTHADGVPIVKPLYYDYPNEDQAYARKNEYIFGNEILISPITKPHDHSTQMGHTKTWLPEGDWIDYFTHLPYKGDTVINTYRSVENMPVFVKRGAIIITNPEYMKNIEILPHNLEVEIFAGKNGKYELIEHSSDKIAKTTFTWDDKAEKLEWRVEDPANIIPRDRKISKVIYKPNETKVIDEMRGRLQKAHISFDLKQQIFDEFNSSSYNYAHFTNMLDTLKDENLRSSLNELAYIRESD